MMYQTDPEGYSINTCTCSDGPYLGARKMGTPCCCERCGFMTEEQLNAILAIPEKVAQHINKHLYYCQGWMQRGFPCVCGFA